MEPHEVKIVDLNPKQFQTLLQLFVKSKPQNVKFPLQDLIRQQWKCPALQLTFLENCTKLFYAKKEVEHIHFGKLQNRTPIAPELVF